jgi:hypothetical protein
LALKLEFGLQSISSKMNGARARAFLKWGDSSKTLIHDLITHKPVSRKQTWVSGTKSWLSRFGPSADRVALECVRLGVNHLSPEQFGRLVTKLSEERLIDAAVRSSVSVRTYVDAGYMASRSFIQAAMSFPQLSLGITLLVQARTGALLTSKYMANAGLIDEKFKERCACGNRNVPETIAHVVLQCPKWKTIRRTWVKPLLDSMPGLSGLSVPNQLVVLLGGVDLVSGLRFPTWAGPVNLFPTISEDDEMDGFGDEDAFNVAHPDEDPALGGDVEITKESLLSFPFAVMARFLQEFHSRQMKILWALSKRADALTGMANPMFD